MSAPLAPPPPKRMGLGPPRAKSSRARTLFSREQVAHKGGVLLGSPERTRQREQKEVEQLLQCLSLCPHAEHLILPRSGDPPRRGELKLLLLECRCPGDSISGNKGEPRDEAGEVPSGDRSPQVDKGGGRFEATTLGPRHDDS